jgi:hypothetical protein
MNKKVQKLILIIALAFAGIILAAILSFFLQYPVYLFINDTDAPINTYLIGGSSPGVKLELRPKEHEFVNMWWSAPQLPEKATYNFGIAKVFYISTFPNDWGHSKK